MATTCYALEMQKLMCHMTHMSFLGLQTGFIIAVFMTINVRDFDRTPSIKLELNLRFLIYDTSNWTAFFDLLLY